jgi:4-hydroxy-2-oxoheptanedioate aldolase
LKKNPVIRALQAGKPQIGTWLSLGSVAAARFMARTGFPWLTVDMEHTHTDIQTAAMMFGAIADAGCVPLARVPAGKHEWIKMVLDCGAMGIVAPMVMDAAEALAIVAATKYAPRGNQLRRHRRRVLPSRQRRDPGRHPDRAHSSRRCGR